MKTFRKILVIVGSLILVLALLTYFLRHDILRNALTVTINKKTNETIKFEIGDISYNVFKSEISFSNSRFDLENIYINKKKSLEINQFRFEKLVIEGLSIFKLIFEREIRAERFEITDPKLWFVDGNSKVQFHENPDPVIKGIKEQPNLLGNLIVIVKQIEIIEGKVKISNTNSPDGHKGALRFEMVLKDFNTKSEDLFNENRVLFAKEHLFKLSDFEYRFPNGDSIGFDSLIIGSQHSQMSITNIEVFIEDKSENSNIKDVNAHIGSLDIFGIGIIDIHNLHNIELDSVQINNSNVTILADMDAGQRKVSDSSSNGARKFVENIGLGKFAINNLNLQAVNLKSDTLIKMIGFDFGVNGIKIDSSIIVSRIPVYEENSIFLSISEVEANDPNKGVNAKLNEVSYRGDEKIFSVGNFNINDVVEGVHSYHVLADALDISGVDISETIDKNSQSIAISVTNPVIDINIEEIHKRNKNSQPSLGSITIDEIGIVNASIRVKDKNKIDLNLLKLDVKWKEIGLNNLSKIQDVCTDKIQLSYGSLKFKSNVDGVSVKTGATSFINHDLKVDNINANYKKRDNDLGLSANGVAVSGFDLKSAINREGINIAEIRIKNPYINGVLGEQKRDKERKQGNSTGKINIKQFTIENAKVDLSLTRGDINSIKTGFNLWVSGFNTTDIKDPNWVRNLDWDIKLGGSHIKQRDYVLDFSELYSKKSDSGLVISDIIVKHNPDSKTNNTTHVNSFKLKELQMKGVDFVSVVKKHTPEIKQIHIERPELDLTIIPVTKEKRNKNVGFKVPIEVDQLSMSDGRFSFLITDSIGKSSINVKELGFLYQLDSSENIFDDVHDFHLSSVSFSKDGFDLITDSIYLDSKTRQIKFGNILFDHVDSVQKIQSKIAGINMKGVNILNGLPTEIEISDVELEDLSLKREYHKDRTEHKSKPSARKPKLPASIKDMAIENFSIYPLSIDIETDTDTLSSSLVIKSMNLAINNIQIDSSNLTDAELDLAESISLDLSDHKFISGDSLYYTSIKGLDYNFLTDQLIFDSLKMIPRYNDDEFFRRAVYQTGRTNLITHKIVCEDFKISDLIHHKLIDMSGIDVHGLNVDIYRNKHYKMNPKAFKKMPQAAIMDLKQKIRIDSVRTHDSRVQYQELAEKSYEPGVVFLDKSNLKIYNINNIEDELDHNSMLEAKLTANLMGKATLILDTRFQLLSPDNNFWVTGHLNRIDFADLNVITQNLVGITMEGGYGSLDIPLISGNENISTGIIYFHYKKLKIDLYNREKAQNATGLAGSLANLMLNDIFIKSNNPGWLGKTRPGEVYMKRDKQKFVVNFIWKSVQSGLMSTMGYNNREQRQEKRARRKSYNTQSRQK